MFIVHVYVQVRPESAEAFKVASQENARNSLQERTDWGPLLSAPLPPGTSNPPPASDPGDPPHE